MQVQVQVQVQVQYLSAPPTSSPLGMVSSAIPAPPQTSLWNLWSTGRLATTGMSWPDSERFRL